MGGGGAKRYHLQMAVCKRAPDPPGVAGPTGLLHTTKTHSHYKTSLSTPSAPTEPAGRRCLMGPDGCHPVQRPALRQAVTAAAAAEVSFVSIGTFGSNVSVGNLGSIGSFDSTVSFTVCLGTGLLKACTQLRPCTM